MGNSRRQPQKRRSNEQPPSNRQRRSRIVTLPVRFQPVDSQTTQVAQATRVNETNPAVQSAPAPTESNPPPEVGTGATSAGNIDTPDTATNNSGSQNSENKRQVWGIRRASKHGPIAPRGTVFLMHENTHLDQSRVNIGKPERTKLKVMFKDNKGNIAIHSYPNRKAAKWDDPAWIADVNKWRSQTFRRTFRLDPVFVKNPVRVKWTMNEFNWFKHLLKKRAKTTQAKMCLADFKKIARKHNRRWVGHINRVGEQLYKGTVLKKEQTIAARSKTALQAIYLRDRDLMNLVHSYIPNPVKVKKENSNEPDDDADSNMADAGDESDTSQETSDSENYDSDDSDAHLEDSSDDEMDGMRPASNQTGAVLIPA